MTDSMESMTVGQLATHIVNRLGRNTEPFVARQLRTLLQRDSITPADRAGEGEVRTALFDEEAMARASLILVLNSYGLSHERLRAAFRCLDNIHHDDKGEPGKVHKRGFACVLDGIRNGEEWFFNFYLSPSVEPSGICSRKPQPVPAMMPGYTTITLPCSEHVAPLLDTGAEG